MTRNQFLRASVLLPVVGLLVAVFGPMTYGQVVLREGKAEYTLGKQPRYLEDQSGTLQIGDLLRVDTLHEFRSFPTADANFGFKQTVHWVKFDIADSSAGTNNNWLLEIGYSAYAAVDLFVVDSQRNITAYGQAGDRRGTKSRPVSFHNYVLELPLGRDSAHTVFVRLEPLAGQVIIPIRIWETRAFIEYAARYQLFWGIYFGMLLIVLLYHAVVYVFNRRQKEYRGYLFLSLYLLTYLLFELTRGSCLGVRYLWPESSWWVDHGFVTSFFLMMLMFMLFYSIILEVPTRMRVLFGVIKAFGFISLITLLLLDFGFWGVSKNAVCFAFGGVAGLLLLTAAFESWRSGPAGRATGFYYMVAAATLYSGGIVLLLHRAGVIKGSHFLTMNAMNLGSIVEFIALSIGLALRIQWQLRKNVQLVAEKKKEILAAKQQETQRMTSAIHDHFGSQLVYLQGRVESLYQDYIDTLDQKRMSEVFDLIGEVLDGIRLLAHSHVPFRLSEKGLRATFQDLVGQYDRHGRVGFDSYLSGTEEGLSQPVQEELYSIVREVFTNILKHSQAEKAALITYDEGDRYCLQVKDDGVGFSETSRTGRGLENIRNRVAAINGEYQFRSDAERGSVFIIKVPFLG